MTLPLPEPARALLDGPNFATVATINADGSPQTSVLWIARDGDDLVFSTVRGRRKERNIARDPRVSVSVIDRNDGYNYLEIRGIATVTEEGGRELINTLSLKYDGKDFRVEPESVVRVVVRVSADHLAGYALA